MPSRFHDKAYDAGTIAKLRIFELYTQEWIPVFLAKEQPIFKGGVHIFDFFCGPGTDALGTFGSPLRILNQLRVYQEGSLKGWGKIPLVVHFYDADPRKIEELGNILRNDYWEVPGVTVDVKCIPFQEALEMHNVSLRDRSVAKLLLIDQFGVDAVTDTIFKELASFPTADFIFFLSSSTLHRFRNHPSIKQKIDAVEDP